MKLEQIINSIESLNKISEAKLPAKTSYRLARVLSTITPEVDSYNKVRGAKLAEYKTSPIKDKDGKDTGIVKFTNEKDSKKFNEEILELLAQEVKLDIPEIKISELGDNLIEPKFLVRLDWLIKE